MTKALQLIGLTAFAYVFINGTMYWMDAATQVVTHASQMAFQKTH